MSTEKSKAEESNQLRKAESSKDQPKGSQKEQPNTADNPESTENVSPAKQPLSDIEKNITTSPKFPDEISAKELFNQAARISDEIKNKFVELEKAKAALSIIEKAHKQVGGLLKPQRRVDQRLGLAKKLKNSDERKLRKTERKSITMDVFLQKQKIDDLQREFFRLCKSEESALKYSTLRAKADSKKYVRENKTFLLNKASGLLNAAIVEHSDILLDLQAKATDETEDGIRTFNSIVRELFFSIDEEGAILCSGTGFKNKLYTAIRIAIQSWDHQGKTFPELVLLADDKLQNN